MARQTGALREGGMRPAYTDQQLMNRLVQGKYESLNPAQIYASIDLLGHYIIKLSAELDNRHRLALQRERDLEPSC